MKKLTLLTIGVFLAVLAMAQNTNHQKYGKNGYNHMLVPKIEKQAKSHAPKTIVWEENFDDGTISDWSLYDQDGDGQNWFTATYDGIACLTSASWSSTGGALTPNNWAVTPAIDLSAVEGAPFIDFTTWAQDQGWTSEHYKVMVSTTDNQVASFTENIFEETLPGTGMFNRTVSLGDFVGETIYIAFVHYDCTDMFQLNLDDISVYSSIEVNLGITEVLAPNNESSCALTNAEEVTVTLANVGGLDATGFDISYTIEGEGGTETVTETFGDVLAAGATVNYTFTQTADLSALDYYTITYEVAIADDVDLTNNTLEQEVRSTDGTLIVSALSDASGDQTWTLTNSAGDVVASFTDYQWDINKDVQVCILDNDCYTFEFSGFDDSGWIELIYNGVTVAGGQNPGNTVGGVTWFGIGGGCAAVDAKLDAITTPDYAQPGIVDISGRILNIGADDITSYDVVYSIDGGDESAVYSVSGVQIASGEEHSFTHDVAYEFTDEASYQITVTIQNVNTDQDANTENNTLSKSILITTQQEQKVVVLEQFTTEMCPNCPPVLTILEQHLDENPNFIMMAHHSGYYTDWLTIPVSEDHLEFFNDGGSTFAPAGMVDRNYNGEDNDQDGTADPGPVFWDGSTHGTSYIDERTAEPAFVTVGINGTNTDGELSLQVSGGFLNDFTQDLGVSLWITEDHITAQSQAGATGSWVHRFSVRGAISDRLGDPIETETTAQGTFNKNYTFTIDGTWDVDELYLVAFVNNMSDDVNDREIHNAVQVKLSELVAAADTYAVNFTVTDQQGAIEGATITIDGNQLTTNASGFATVNMADGTYNYSVVKAGYADVNEEVTVAGADIDVPVEMTSATMLTKAQLQVYPNPSNGVFNVTVDGVYTIQVVNNVGQVVYEETIDTNSTVDLSDLSSGMYVVSVRNNTKIATQTIIIQ